MAVPYENLGNAIVAMLSMGDMYPEVVTATWEEVTVHGYSFEPKETNAATFNACVGFIKDRLPRYGRTETRIAIVCPNGLLEWESHPTSDEE